MRTADELQTVLPGAREARRRIGFVPTMGALHDGHLRLVQTAWNRTDVVVVSIFVNPTQFAAGEDFSTYPRTFEADLDTCEDAGVDVVFAPDVATMYPEGTDGGVAIDPGPLGTVLEGASRPTHFRGMLTVVAKLLNLVQPDAAFFGEKDYQQLVLVRRMALDLRMGVEIVGVPIVRERDGLAMSSRNRHLSATERADALTLSRALAAGVGAAGTGSAAVQVAAEQVAESGPVEVDYVAVTDADLDPPRDGADARLLIAARVGATRLIDNVAVRLGDRGADDTAPVSGATDRS